MHWILQIWKPGSGKLSYFFACFEINFTLNLLLVSPKNICAMGKSKDKESKEVKKPATKSLKEKRLEKKEKKAGKV